MLPVNETHLTTSINLPPSHKGAAGAGRSPSLLAKGIRGRFRLSQEKCRQSCGVEIASHLRIVALITAFVNQAEQSTMTDQSQPTICVNVAIDHRLLPLFKPLPTARYHPGSDHLRLTRRLGRRLRRGQEQIPDEEIGVTVDMASPASTGGICFILQQPAGNHPYHLGTDAVIESSPTLDALLQVWSTVSCGSPRPSIFDRLPFIRPQDRLSTTLKTQIEDKSLMIIQAKRPEVVVCMWRRKRDKDTGKYEDVKGFRALEGVGVGHTFTKPDHELGPGLLTRRVNAFHPSHAVNYNPHVSCFRQLLMLEVAQACGIYSGDWHNESWMTRLRTQCKKKTGELRDKPGQTDMWVSHSTYNAAPTNRYTQHFSLP